MPLAPTPAIADADEPTPELTEGPYFKPDSPRRRSIVAAGAPGTRLTLTGRVLTTSGRPVAQALIDFWQASARGVYDNSGYRFRGHQLTDAKGRYTLFTVVPGPLSGPHEAHPREGAGARRARADDAAVLPGRRRERERRHLRHASASSAAGALSNGRRLGRVRLRARSLAQNSQCPPRAFSSERVLMGVSASTKGGR